jgi:hypothetical protein
MKWGFALSASSHNVQAGGRVGTYDNFGALIRFVLGYTIESNASAHEVSAGKAGFEGLG